MTTGSENMPAPMMVPPIITTPPNKDGRVAVVVSVAICRNLQSFMLFVVNAQHCTSTRVQKK
jgi:hypothetical protein